jgi:hypothetical protein
MSELEIKESHRSWRPRSWLMIKDGRKQIVSRLFVRIGMGSIGVLFLAFQGFSMGRSSAKRKGDSIFAPPGLKPPDPTTYIPGLMNREVELREEKDHARAISQARTGKDPRLERIKTISFSSHQGVPAGTEAMVVLTSGGANGMVKATLSEGLKSQGDVLLPQGTVFLGSGSSSEDRLFIAFKKAILPDHSVMKIKALAYDKDDRILGVKGKRVSDYAFRLAASSGLIFLGGMADGMREEVNLNVGERRRPSVRDAALSGVATATDDVGKDMLEKMKSQDSRVEVAHSTSVLIIFDDATDN